MKPKIKTQNELRDELPLIQQIDHVLIEYGICRKSKFPFKEWHPTLAYECRVSEKEIKRELEKMFVEQSKL